MSLAAWSFLIATLGLVISVLSYFSSRGAISREQTDREKAIDDAWSFEWASQRPVVYPVLSGVVSGSTALPLKNGGRGPALNVVAELEYRNQDGKPDGAWRRVVGTIAAGRRRNSDHRPERGAALGWHLGRLAVWRPGRRRVRSPVQVLAGARWSA
jgi:hypothetical protein